MLGPNDLVVSAQELIEHMSLRGLSGSQLIAVEQVIAGVQGGLEDYLNRPVTIRQFTETLQIDYTTGTMQTTHSPVVSIISRVDTTPPTGAVPGGIVAVTGAFDEPTDILGLGGWQTVTYTAGIDGKNDESIRLKVMEVSARYISTHHDDVLSNASDVAGRPPLPDSKFWTDDELRQFDRKRRRVMV